MKDAKNRQLINIIVITLVYVAGIAISVTALFEKGLDNMK